MKNELIAKIEPQRAGMKRSELAKEQVAVLREYHALKNEMKATAAHAKATNDFSDFNDKQRRLSQLKERQLKISEEIWKLKEVSRVRQNRREKLFLDLARKRLGEEVYREIWAEIDRLESEQWAATWNQEGEHERW